MIYKNNNTEYIVLIQHICYISGSDFDQNIRTVQRNYFNKWNNMSILYYFRELNELRRPSSENPEILRFFKYMKAAKDGQDNHECELVYSLCQSQRSPDDSVPMMTTYNEINKLVQARNAKSLAESSTVPNEKSESTTEN